MLLLLVIASALHAGEPLASAEELDCVGTIISFEKEAFSGMQTDGGCDVFDVTWVSIKTPKEFEGVRQMLLSGPGDQSSPFGKVGDEIKFKAYRATLDSAKKVSNQSSQHNASSGHGSCFAPAAPATRVAG